MKMTDTTELNPGDLLFADFDGGIYCYNDKTVRPCGRLLSGSIAVFIMDNDDQEDEIIILSELGICSVSYKTSNKTLWKSDRDKNEI